MMFDVRRCGPTAMSVVLAAVLAVVRAGLGRRVRRAVGVSAVVAYAMVGITACDSAQPGASAGESPPEPEHVVADHPYVGMWVTADGRIRQELLPGGRYDEARGGRESAYTGRYEVRGSHIEYWDDTGFTADGTFVTEDVLHHGGMVFYRELR